MGPCMHVYVFSFPAAVESRKKKSRQQQQRTTHWKLRTREATEEKLTTDDATFRWRTKKPKLSKAEAPKSADWERESERELETKPKPEECECEFENLSWRRLFVSPFHPLPLLRPFGVCFFVCSPRRVANSQEQIVDKKS